MDLTLSAHFIERLQELSPGATKAYLALLWLKATKTPHPSQPAIARRMNASTRSVFTYLHELERAGYIRKLRTGSGRRTEYQLVKRSRYGVRA